MRSLLPGTALAVAMTCSASAAPASAERPARVAVAESAVRPVAMVPRDDEATCSRARRRLWIEGEGWIVRRITTCR